MRVHDALVGISGFFATILKKREQISKNPSAPPAKTYLSLPEVGELAYKPGVSQATQALASTIAAQAAQVMGMDIVTVAHMATEVTDAPHPHPHPNPSPHPSPDPSPPQPGIGHLDPAQRYWFEGQLKYALLSVDDIGNLALSQQLICLANPVSERVALPVTAKLAQDCFPAVYRYLTSDHVEAYRGAERVARHQLKGLLEDITTTDRMIIDYIFSFPLLRPILANLVGENILAGPVQVQARRVFETIEQMRPVTRLYYQSRIWLNRAGRYLATLISNLRSAVSRR